MYLIMCILLFWWFMLHLVPFTYRKNVYKFHTQKSCITMIFSVIYQARINYWAEIFTNWSAEITEYYQLPNHKEFQKFNFGWKSLILLQCGNTEIPSCSRVMHALFLLFCSHGKGDFDWQWWYAAWGTIDSVHREQTISDKEMHSLITFMVNSIMASNIVDGF